MRFPWDTCFPTPAIGPMVYDRFAMLANHLPLEGPNLTDEQQAMTVYLNKHSRDDRPGPFNGSFKCIAILGYDRPQKRWFPQPDNVVDLDAHREA